MTLPNRSNYTPGEKKRERKYEEPEEEVFFKTETADSTRGLAPQNYDEALRDELLQVLSGIAPESSSGRGTAISSPEHPMIKLAKSKALAETAYQRLHADECYQQLPVKEVVMSFTAMMDPSFAPSTPGADPPEHIVSGMAADTGLQPQHSSSTANQINASYRLDPQWATLFERAGPERQQLINGLSKLEQASGGSDLDSAMDMLQDAPARGKYQRSSSNLHEWSKQRLYQQLRATMLSRGVGIGSRSAPSSPIDSPFNQPPKKRANLSKHAKEVLTEWFHDHLHHPYPTEEEKEWLSQHGGITIEQVNNWFINTRGRKWKPMMRRILDDREAGLPSATFDRLVAKIEQPYAN